MAHLVSITLSISLSFRASVYVQLIKFLAHLVSIALSARDPPGLGL